MLYKLPKTQKMIAIEDTHNESIESLLHHLYQQHGGLRPVAAALGLDMRTVKTWMDHLHIPRRRLLFEGRDYLLVERVLKRAQDRLAARDQGVDPYTPRRGRPRRIWQPKA